MTCPGCSRERVTLIGGLCGHCESKLSRGVADAIEEADLDLDLSIRDVFEHKDGTYHIRLDTDQPTRRRETLVVEGDFEDPGKPDGDVYELPNGHRYEMGTTHDCGVADCPANVGDPDD
jgi:hypothetical protein